MKVPLLIAYLVLNLVVAVSLHVHTRQRTFEAPKPLEVAVYFLVMLVLGMPIFVFSMLFHHGPGVDD